MRKTNFNIEELGLPTSNIYYIIFGLIEEKVNIKNIELTIPHAKAQLSHIYDTNPDLRENVYNLLEYQIKEIKNEINKKDFDLKENREEILCTFHNIINEIFKKPIVNYRGIKLQLNLPKNVIYDFIKQLKIITFNGKTPILTQQNEILAEFLINHIEGFENSSIKNISKEISRQQALSKGKLEVKKIN